MHREAFAEGTPHAAIDEISQRTPPGNCFWHAGHLPCCCGDAMAFREIASEFLRKDAESFRPITSDPAPYSVMAFRVERHLPTLQWLVAHDCDCEASLAAYETTARLYPDSPERKQFLTKLARLRERSPAPLDSQVEHE